jgi:membrane protein required for colicin V production
MLGLAAWGVAGYVAYLYGGDLEPMAEKAIGNPDLADPLAYVGVFVLALIVLSLAANLVGRMVRLSALGGLDRTLGLLFGIARGAALLVAAYIPLGLMLPPDRWPEAAQRAWSVPLIYQGAVLVAAEVPPAYRPRVAPPPQTRPTTSADLLHATPEGRALGPPVGHP